MPTSHSVFAHSMHWTQAMYMIFEWFSQSLLPIPVSVTLTLAPDLVYSIVRLKFFSASFRWLVIFQSRRTFLALTNVVIFICVLVTLEKPFCKVEFHWSCRIFFSTQTWTFFLAYCCSIFLSPLRLCVFSIFCFKRFSSIAWNPFGSSCGCK